MPVKSSGANSAELTYDGSVYLDADQSIRCLRDHMIIEPLPVEHSKFIDVIEHIKPLRGIVRAVGPGHYPRKYDHPDKHRRTKMWLSKKFRPTETKVGDIVELGNFYHDGKAFGYTFPQIIWGGKLHIICREEDVCGIVTDE